MAEYDPNPLLEGIQTNSLVRAELVASTNGRPDSLRYWMRVSWRNAAMGREAGPFNSRREAFQWLAQNFGG